MLTKSGTGTLVIANSGVNDYAGGTIITAGGGTLQVGNGGTTGNLPAGGAVTNDATLVFNRSDAITFTGPISGTGDLRIASGTVTLGGASTYTGATTVTNGAAIRVTNANANGSSLGLGTGVVRIHLGSTLDLTPNGTANNLDFGQKQFVIEGSGAGGQGVIFNSGVAQQNAFEHVTLAGNSTIGGSQRYDIRAPQVNGTNSGVLDLAGHTLTKNGNNQFSLVAVNVSDAGNIVVNGGTFAMETTTVMGGTNTVTFNDGTTAQFFSNTATESAITRPMVFNGAVRVGSNSNNNNSIVASDITLNGNVSVGINNAVTSLFTLTGTISETGGPRSLTKTGPSVFFVRGANTYSGPTTITGTMVATILADGGAPSGIGQSSAGGTNLVLAGGVLGYNGSANASTDRLFTMGPGNAGLDVSADGGTAAFTNTGPLAVAGGAPILFTLSGFNPNPSVLAPRIQNGTSAAAVVSLAKIGDGSWTLQNANTYTGTTRVDAGTLRVEGSIANSAGVTVTAGTFDAAATQIVQSLALEGGNAVISGTGVKALKVGNNTATFADPATSSLAVSGSSKMDVGSGALIVDYAPGSDAAAFAAVRSLILTGWNNGDWQGFNSITSSAAATNPSGTGVGYALASDVLGPAGGAFATGNTDGSAVLARYTLLGDADLSGNVDFNDLVRLAQNYNNTSGSAVWYQADFTYDGNVDFNDLVKLAQNYNLALPTDAIPGAPAGFEADLAAAFASVPEPGALSLIALSACGVAGGRRRRATAC